ncbi:hypothetical protein LCGC14_1226530 [marine sediment metagenome]|uniref:Uncharacterized protein n=1 Tax=marine sediment metagenome TaxID=412755 RepID=A0A0F9L9R8_9ZZZZ
MKTPLGIKIGCDPEFEVRSKRGAFVPADRILGYSPEDAIGTDGRADTAEIRSQPGSNYQVMKSINTILSQARRKLANYNAYAGSGKNVPLGGHIHFSGISPEPELVKRLDKFIAKPLNSISDTSGRGGHYGRYGEVRGQPHGWEYRSPLSWLATPQITNGVLSIAWLLARATKRGHLGSLNTKHNLLSYAYKRERQAIDGFFTILKIMKTENKQLEHIEIFHAWQKRDAKPKPSIFPHFSNDYSLGKIKGILLERHTEHKRYLPAMCYELVCLVGASQQRSDKSCVFVSQKIWGMLPQSNNHIGTDIMVADWLDSRAMVMALSYKLRQKPRRAAWVVKRLITIINKEIQCAG